MNQTCTLAELKALPETQLTREDLFDLLEGYESAVADMMETVYNACQGCDPEFVGEAAINEVEASVDLYVGTMRQEGVKWVVDYKVFLVPTDD